MNSKRSILLLVLLLAGASATVQAGTGCADFTKFVALGDSLVSGECNASVVDIFQASAFSRLIYMQVHGTDVGFEQATVSETGMPNRLILGPTGPMPVPGPKGVPTNEGLARPYDNLGMSGGIRVNDLLTISGLASCEAANQAWGFDRLGCERIELVLRSQGTAVEQAKALEATFVALWAGGNDVLRAALGGTVIEGVTMTPVDDFEASYRTVVEELTQNGARLAMANVPNVGDIPFMNTVPPVVIDPATGEPVEIGGQPVPLIGPDGPLSLLDKVTLLAPPYLQAGCGIPPTLGGGSDPDLCPDGFLPGDLILDTTEQGQVGLRVEAFNEIIAEIAWEYGAALYDFASFLADANDNGVVIGGIEYTTEFVYGGLVSFDGFHPNPLVSAMNANGFIRAINWTYGASIPQVDLTEWLWGYPGNVGPPQGIPTISFETAEQIRQSLALPVIDPAMLDTQDPGRRERLGSERSRGVTGPRRTPGRSRRESP